MTGKWIPTLAEQGIFVTEDQLADMMAAARRAKTIVVEVEWRIYEKWQEIQSALRDGELDQRAAESAFERDVFPHLGLRPGGDYDPRNDTIDIVPRRRVSALVGGA